MEEIINQLRFFLLSVLTGIVLMLGFDVVGFLRLPIRKRKILLFLLDYIYWVVGSFFVFVMIYQMNDGQIRGFALWGIGFGILLYEQGPGKLLKKLKQKMFGKKKK